MCEAKVMFDYDAEAEDELTLKEGDIIQNIEKKEDGWWEGELYGRRGMFPENFVEEIKPAASDKPATEKVPIDKPANNKAPNFAKVTFDYDAENDDELTLKEGDMVKVIEQEEEGWWKGELHGKIGVFPTNFVEIVKGPVAGAQEVTASVEDKPQQEKKTAKSIGGVGFGGLFTQNDLSGIKLRKRDTSEKAPPKKGIPVQEQTSELNKKLSNKRTPPEIPQPARPSKHGFQGKAIVEFDYDGEQSDELSLRKDDVINILDKNVADGWWKGELQGKIGVFPENFVRLLPDDEENTKSDKPSKEMPTKLPPGNDVADNKPGRPEPPFPKLKPTTDKRPPLPGNKPREDKEKKPADTHPPEFKPVKEEKPPPPGTSEKPPVKKSPPLLPKKPEKSKPPDVPKVELRQRNGPHVDPTKRFSEMPPRSDVEHDTKMKRHSSGSEISVNLNDIKSGNVLQPLTSDRPKQPNKNLPKKYGKDRKPTTPEKLSNDVSWSENAAPVMKPTQLADKPKKPAAPEAAKPTVAVTQKPVAVAENSKTNEVTVSAGILKKIQDDINSLKSSLQSLSNEYKENIHKSEAKFKAMETKMTNELDDLTKELDEEKKARSALDVEVNRLRKLVKQMS